MRLEKRHRKDEFGIEPWEIRLQIVMALKKPLSVGVW
jgi:hypothetical protein